MEYLPEECVTEIISRTSPRDACRSSSISRTFKSIADSDLIWNKFLPSDLTEIISTVQSPPLYSTKKQLYFQLTHQPILFHGGIISLAVDRESGKKCYMIGARGLVITWGTSPQYWQWAPYHGSRFHEVAILQMVWWLEIKCKIETRSLSPNTVYVAFLVFNLERRSNGFISLPINVSFKYIDEMGADHGGEMMTTTFYLKLDANNLPLSENYKIPQRSTGSWLEVELGEFVVDLDNNRQVEIQVFEVEQGNLKSGLVIEGIEFRPKFIV